ncbi:DUF2269 family protein [Chitinophaga japonensis]|uniref:Putative membrane protein DUF2214 n=1 Tax=Chitinophaga japonensis TaxID=104662 RepID=A0A562T1N4_CHIJA|nr:DUF2269 family protein [Chitinophaga japonensis]TWI86770.1 putative membrane protein DUF2214 [Chitinophaga japonensis]
MTTISLYHTALTLHIVALTLMAGTTLADFIMIRQFWAQYSGSRQKGQAVYEALSRFRVFTGIGMLLLIISGVSMMALTRGAYGEQTWFRVKFALVLVIIISELAVRRRQGALLQKRLGQEADLAGLPGIGKIKTNIGWFHAIQIALFVTIFTLSVFKFN